MSDIRITNCHIHTFTNRHVPFWYPHPALAIFRVVPGLVALLVWLMNVIGQDRLAQALNRLRRFQMEGDKPGQAEILDDVIPLYPDGTRFVVLPMAMDGIGFGPARMGLREQHDELAALRQHDRYRRRMIPFATIFPDDPAGVDEVRRCFDSLHFRGLKLYPRLGFPPDHEVLMREVYPMLIERDLPVVSHCSRGGIKGRDINTYKADLYTEPQAFLPVLREFPQLRVNLAHFGGAQDWVNYIDNGIDPDDPAQRRDNWLAAILDLIRSGDWPGIYTDISYTLFYFDDNIPFLKVFLKNEMVRQKVLFGSDFYMTRQENLSDRAVSFRLRDALGEKDFRQIAEINPEVWLGERATLPEPAAWPEV